MERNPCRGWMDGDPVTYVGGNGTVLMLGTVVVRKGQSGRWFLKVQVAKGGRLGAWMWPEGWIIGQGSHRGTCVECGQDFLTDAPTEACPPCNRAQEAGEGLQIRNLKAYYAVSHAKDKSF